MSDCTYVQHVYNRNSDFFAMLSILYPTDSGIIMMSLKSIGQFLRGIIDNLRSELRTVPKYQTFILRSNCALYIRPNIFKLKQCV